MIKLQDLSDLMQKVIATRATFMISQTGVPGYYSIYASYHNGKTNKSARLTFHEKEGVIVQYADLEHSATEFSDIDSAATHLCKEVGVDIIAAVKVGAVNA